MDHHVRGAAQHVAHLVSSVQCIAFIVLLYYCIALYRGGDVLRLETLHGAVDGGHRRRVVGVHGGLELGLDQAWQQQSGGVEQVSGVTWRDAAHPDVAAQLPQLLPPALQQPRHRELGGGVEPGLCCYVTVTSLHQEMGVWVVVMT